MQVDNAAGIPVSPERSTQCCSLGSGLLSCEEAERYAALFKVLSDPGRLQLLSQIAQDGCEPISVSGLTQQSGLSQPTVSHHLKKLVEAGLVDKEMRGKWAHFTPRPEGLAALHEYLAMLG